MENDFLCIGVMTGNSLDAVDVVLTDFNGKKISDICAYSKNIPEYIADGFRILKRKLKDNEGNIEKIYSCDKLFFLNLHNAYVNLVAETINEMLSINHIERKKIEAIGFHGQTCYHFPPSIAGKKQEPNTLQIGSGQMLSTLTQIPVVFDFRSDDIMNGGEGAPLAPMHNFHLAEGLKNKNIFPVVFCNGGNTGNLAVVYENKVFGFDCGPFNHFADLLVKSEKSENCDFDGKYGKEGKIRFNLLADFFEHSVLTDNGDNFILKNPPKSSDPAWYVLPNSLKDKSISFADRLRTAEFFSAYIMVYSMKYFPVKTPDYFLVFGGGWNNPLIFDDFKNLVRGQAEVLPCHKEIFEKIKNPQAKIQWSDEFGYNGKFMEARIFADMARCRLQNIAFSNPEITGCRKPTIGGIVVYPDGNDGRLWSRAAKGWNKA